MKKINLFTIMAGVLVFGNALQASDAVSASAAPSDTDVASSGTSAITMSSVFYAYGMDRETFYESILADDIYQEYVRDGAGSLKEYQLMLEDILAEFLSRYPDISSAVAVVITRAVDKFVDSKGLVPVMDETDAEWQITQKMFEQALRECFICLEPFSVEHKATIAPCGHMAGLDCWRQWQAQGKNTCPLCRGSLGIVE